MWQKEVVVTYRNCHHHLLCSVRVLFCKGKVTPATSRLSLPVWHVKQTQPANMDKAVRPLRKRVPSGHAQSVLLFRRETAAPER